MGKLLVKSSAYQINGVLLLDKPCGISSSTALQRVKQLCRAHKAGHTGSLDPLATGMLPICLGEATKFSQLLLDADKIYQVTALLGVRTDTADAQGLVLCQRTVDVALEKLLHSLSAFQGEFWQKAPMHSALKYQGKPLYYYARRNIEVPNKVRPVVVKQMTLIDFTGEQLTLLIHCSKGTYIRAIIDELGEALGCGAHVIDLRRLSIAQHKNSDMLTMGDLENVLGSLNVQNRDTVQQALSHRLLPLTVLVEHLPEYNLSKEQGLRLIHGGSLILFACASTVENYLVRLTVGQEKLFIGIGQRVNDKIVPKRLLSNLALNIK